MNIATFRDYCRALPGVEEALPFGPDVVVYKVAGKMFATASLPEVAESPNMQPSRVNLKCDPDRAVELRDRHEDITPGYHMNKRHWNTLDLLGHLPSALVRELIDHSYSLVVAALPKAVRSQLSSS
jgi:predicted DNA-binding protein (MmcQ/YjbR family)